MHSIIIVIPLVTFLIVPKIDLRIVTTTIQSPSTSTHIKYHVAIHHYVFSSLHAFNNATIDY
jgi:hypothetical protein